ncbi:endothelin-converting enzyme homolog isoform X3 [Planococcus citri]|uniref:endothelin-converting enzyme homolog isoform X3 n=1 Tax=Planococcus citri TaxID=170843 RepID=UPI0031F86192
MSMKMTCYKPSMLEEDVSSLGSIHLSEGVSSTATHIRYHSGPYEMCYIENVGLSNRKKKTKWTSELCLMLSKPCAFWKWKNRPTLDRRMLLFLGGIFLTLFSIIVITLLATTSNDEPIYVPYFKVPAGWQDEYCFSEKCIHTASYMLSSMNQSISPCNNFYEFACGRWVLSNPIPEGRSIWGMFNQLEQANQLVIKNVLERENFAKTECEAEQKARRYYLSCLDPNETTEKLGATPMINLLKEIGGWNVIDQNFDIENWDYQVTLEKLQNNYSLGGLFFWVVAEDDKNSSGYIIQIDQPALTLPSSENYNNITNNTKLFNAYLDYMTTVGTLLGGEPNSTRSQMQDVIYFETKLASIMVPDEERRDEEKIYHRMTISELQSKAPFLNWEQYFTNAFQRINRTVTKDQLVVIYAVEYMKELDKFLKDYIGQNDNNKRILHNYLVWQAVRTMTGYLSKPFRDSYKGLRKILFGSEGSLESWRYCIADTNNVLGFAVGALYVREAFHGNSKPLTFDFSFTQAKKMINDIRDAFKQNFEKLRWMDLQTLLLAKNKADSITDMIGFPDYILDPKELNSKYEGLDIKEDEYFLNNIRINQFRIKENLEKLDQPVNKSKWLMTPSTVNAYYSPNTNRIVFPAGILQAPFYDQDQQLSLNYGAIGVVMGHELTHAFDDQGREYDSNGNLNRWWKNITIERFKNATQCVINQYSDFHVNGKYISGVRTLGENIADNGGLKAAYHAYLKVNKENPKEFALPGLNYTQDQLFFISFAQVWCSASTSEAIALQIDKDTHVPSEFRVNGPLQNLREFSEIFHCPLGSEMNPKLKCEIW